MLQMLKLLRALVSKYKAIPLLLCNIACSNFKGGQRGAIQLLSAKAKLYRVFGVKGQRKISSHFFLFFLLYRRESGVEGNFRLDSPATSERIRMACVDQFTNQASNGS